MDGEDSVYTYSIWMPSLLLDHRRLYRNDLRTEHPGETVTYLLPNGKCRTVVWLGVIPRAAARQLAGARPVRPCHFESINEGTRLSPL